MNQVIGYARVSTQEQNLGIQLDALKKRGCVKIYEEKKSAKNFERPVFEDLMLYLSPGDTLVIWSLDRLSRNFIEAVPLLYRLKEMKVQVDCIMHPIDLDSAHGRLVVGIMSLLAQFEREQMLERSKAGLERKRREDPDWKPGRPEGQTKMDTAKVATYYVKMVDKWDGHHPTALTKTAKHFKLGEATVRRYIDKEKVDRPRGRGQWRKYKK